MDFSNLTTIQKQGFIGSILIFIGCFLPFVQVPFFGGMSFVRIGGWGYYPLITTIIAMILTYLNRIKGLKALSILLTIYFIISFIKMKSNLDSLYNIAGKDPFGLGKITEQMVGASYAWFFLFGGCIILLATTVFDKKFIK